MNASSKPSSSGKQPASGMDAVATKVKSALAAFRTEGLPADAVEVGRIIGAWGVKGWVKVQGFSAESDALGATEQWFVLPAERGAKVFDGALALEVKTVRPHTDVWVAQFAQLDDRDVAEALKGARIFVAREDFPELDDEDEFYWVDLIGLQVINREGVVLGAVRELISNGPQSVLVIDAEPGAGNAPAQEGQKGKKSAGTREILIPFVSAYVDSVSLEENRIQVDWQPDY